MTYAFLSIVCGTCKWRRRLTPESTASMSELVALHVRRNPGHSVEWPCPHEAPDATPAEIAEATAYADGFLAGRERAWDEIKRRLGL